MDYARAGELCGLRKSFWGRISNHDGIAERAGEIKIHAVTANGEWGKIDFKGPITEFKNSWVELRNLEFICVIDQVNTFVRLSRQAAGGCMSMMKMKTSFN